MKRNKNVPPWCRKMALLLAAMSALVALANAGMMQMGGQQNMMMNMMQGGMNMVPMGNGGCQQVSGSTAWKGLELCEWLSAWKGLKLCEWLSAWKELKLCQWLSAWTELKLWG